jgi:hypothetical protein
MRQRSGLGRRGRDHRGAQPSRDRQSFQGHTVAAAARAQARAAAPLASTSRTSKARRAPNARWKSPQRAVTTC